MRNITFPKCQKCQSGDLVPLSDFGGQGSPVRYKAWVCTNPHCGFSIKIRGGNIYRNEPILSGAKRSFHRRALPRGPIIICPRSIVHKI